MSRASFLRILAITAAALLLFSSWLFAGRRVIDEVTITEEYGCSVVRVAFNFRVRYVTHFPVEEGTDLRVQLAPVAAGPADEESLCQGL